AIVPMIVYFSYFKNSIISSQPADWAAFGDYLSGTSGTILSFFAVLFSLISIYFTIRIAKVIQENEFKFNKKQSEIETKLLHQQNMPYPYLDFNKHRDLTQVVLQNGGIGTLIVTKWQIKSADAKIYSDFHKLLDDKLTISRNDSKILFNTAENHVIAPNAEKTLLEVTPYDTYNDNFKHIQNAIRQIICETEVTMEFEDVFSNKSTLVKDLKFFKNK
ncbi:MAG: hypothetical protein MUF37_06485, partial [Methanoregulaceae archaeon]|nr:hypothetical protein [Methanoregulaceae archaeon]